MIRNVKLYPIYDSTGEITIKVKVWTVKGFFTACATAGTSKGENEAKSLRYNEVTKVFPKIRNSLIGLDETDWVTIDKILLQLDNSNDFQNIGGNLALATSLAVARASSDGELWRLEGPKSRMAFPYPLGNVIGGAKHGGKSTWQEFLIIPQKARDPEHATRMNFEMWHTIGDELKRKGILTGKNIENAWMCRLDCIKTLDFLSNMVEDWDAKIGIDFAASSFWDGKNYVYKDLGKKISPEEHFDTILQVAEQYKLYFLEDPFHENDFRNFADLRQSLPKTLVVGDDLFCTNAERLRKGIVKGSANGIIIKPNQIGTLSQAFQTAEMARQNGIHTIASHRSRETYDDWLSDLSLLWKSPLIKIGNLGPDTMKHNRLIELWHDIPHNSMAELP